LDYGGLWVFRDISFLRQRQAVGILAQKQIGVTAYHRHHGIIGHIAAESLTGAGPVVIDLAVVFVVFLLKKNAALVIGMDHEDLALGGGFLPGHIDAFFSVKKIP